MIKESGTLKRLSGKVSLITGAASGIGKAIAEIFHREGSFVILSDIDDESGQQITDSLGSNAAYIHLDVSREDEWTVNQHPKGATEPQHKGTTTKWQKGMSNDGYFSIKNGLFQVNFSTPFFIG